MCKMTPKGIRLHLNNFISISCGVTELLRKVSRWGEVESAHPGEVGLKFLQNVYVCVYSGLEAVYRLHSFNKYDYTQFCNVSNDYDLRDTSQIQDKLNRRPEAALHVHHDERKWLMPFDAKMTTKIKMKYLKYCLSPGRFKSEHSGGQDIFI